MDESFKLDDPQGMVALHMPLIKFVAAKLSKRLPLNVDGDDLIQWGSMGLLDAIKKFNPERNNKFKTYAEFRIRGAMLDGLRDQDLMSRSTRDREKKIFKASDQFEREFMRKPESGELAEKLGVTIKQLDEMRLKSRPIFQLSIDELEIFTSDDRKALLVSAQNKSESILEKIEAMQKLERMVDGRHPIDRACLILLFVWGFTQREIAELFGVSESRISQRIKSVHFSNLYKWAAK